MKLGGWAVLIGTMILVLTLVGVDTGVDSVLPFFGVEVDSNNSVNLDMEDGGLWGKIFGLGVGILVILGVGSSIIVGLFGKGYDVSLVLAPLIVSVAGIGYSFVSIFNTIKLGGVWWMTSVSAVILSALMIGFLFSCVDYFAGR